MKITLQNFRDVYKAKQASIDTMELKGYTLIENLFVDNSRMGSEDEPALTVTAFEKKIIELLEAHGPLYATITNAGQFQVYIGLFKKTGKSKSKKVANNTLEIDYGNGKSAIRLHDTDILTFENGFVTLDSGGWQTVTTKARMNQFMPDGLKVIQKDYQWYFQSLDGSIVPFEDGMKIKI